MLTTNEIESSILEVLARRPRTSVESLREILQHDYEVCVSCSQLYKICKKMCLSYILIREHGTFSLHNLRIDKLDSYLDLVRKNYFVQSIEKPFLNMFETKVVKATSYIDAMQKRHQIMSEIMKEQKKEDFFLYESHFYYVLGEEKRIENPAEDFNTTLFATGRKSYCICGNTTFLDTYKKPSFFKRHQQHPNYHEIHTTKTPFPKEGYNLYVYGDYIIEEVEPQEFTKEILVFFKTVQNLKEIDKKIIQVLFTKKMKRKFTIRKNPQEAGKLKKEIQKWFPKKDIY